MTYRLAKRAFMSFGTFWIILSPLAVRVAAQGRGPHSLQPDLSAVFVTLALRHDTPVAHGKILLLPSKTARTASVRVNGSLNASMTPSGSASPLTFFGGPPFSVSSVVTPTTTQPEAEEEIAADPSDLTGSNLVAAISDFSQPSGFNFTKWTLSKDGGSTWMENFVPYNTGTGLLTTSDGHSWDANSDPVLAFDQSGHVYLSDLYIALDSLGRITAEGLYVSTDTFGNLQTSNFGHTYRVRANFVSQRYFSIEDKPWISVDVSNRATAGYVYASWSHFTGCQNKFSLLYGYYLSCSSDVIYVAYSTNHGQTWSSPKLINPKGQNGAVQGSQVAVGPDGRVHVAYEFFGSNNQRQQYLSVGTWTAGVLTFSAPFAVTPVFNELTFSGCSSCTASYRINSFPALAVGPSGSTYIEYGAQADATSAAQVNFVACTSACTGSSAFAAPMIINDSLTGNHFFPAIAVGPNGVVNSSWFDTRNNPANPDYLDVYAAFLTYDSGTNSFTVSPNARVTPASNDASISDLFGDTGFIGDYIGIAATAATPGAVHPVWTNASGLLGSLVSGSLQTATLTVP